MKIILGADHGGFETKEKIKEYEEFLSFKYISEDFKNLCLLKIKNLWNDINKK